MKPLKESFIKAKDLDNLNKKKYILTDKTLDLNGHTLYRIQALKNIPSKKVKKGDLGGWVESYDNLDQKGDCWVGDEAKVYRNAKVYDNALICDNALVYRNVKVYGDALVYGDVQIYDVAKVYGDAEVCGNAIVYGNAEIYGSARVDYIINKGKINK